MKPNTIYIIGAGAIGKVLAAFLALEGKRVVLIRGSVSEGRKSTEIIEVELPDHSIVQAELETAFLNHFTSLDGIILFTNKSFGNETLAKSAYVKVKHNPIVIMQNGLGVELPFVQQGFSSVYRCVLFATSQPIFKNRYKFRPASPSPIGSLNGGTEELHKIVQGINNRYFPFREEPDIEPVVWTKTILNCVFNSICPLLEVDNGIFHRNQHALMLAKQVVAECVRVANAKGIFLQEEEVLNTLLHISRSSNGQIISTYQDIKNQRPTEIATLNGAIVKAATSVNMETLVPKTALLGDMIALKSHLNQ